MPRTPPRFLPDAAALAAIVALVAILAAAGRVPSGDGPHLAAMTFELADAARSGAVGDALGTWASRVSPQPPLGYLPGVLLAIPLGDRWIAPLLAGGGALWLIWDALRRVAGGAPWPAALVIVASPMCWLYVEQYGWDLLAAAAVLQSTSWLDRSDGLRRRREAVMFGVWMGVGFLTKYTFPMFLWLPCLAVGLGVLRGPDRAARLRALGLAVAAFALLLGPWLARNGPELAAYLDRSVGADAVAAVTASRAGAARFGADALALYPLALKDALGWPGVVCLLGVGIASVFLGRGVPPRNAPLGTGEPDLDARRVPALPLLAAAGGLLVLSSLEQSQDRYALPALVALSALALPLPRLPWGQEVFVGVFGIQLLGTIATFRPGAPTYPPRFDHGLASAAEMSWPVTRAYLPTHVDLAAWRVDEALGKAATFAAGDRYALVLPDDPRLPEPGVYLLRARQLGLEGAPRVARPRGDRPPRDGWPDDVGAAYVVWTPGVDVATEAWLAGKIVVAELALAGGVRGAVVR